MTNTAGNVRRRSISPRSVYAGDSLDTAVAALTLALIAYWPYSFLLAMNTNLTVMGFSLFVTVGPLAISFLACALTAIKYPRPSIMLILAALTIVGVVYARSYLGISETNGFELKEVVGDRYFILLPCYLIMAKVACGKEWFLRWAPKIIVLNAIVSAVFAIGYIVGFVPLTMAPVGEEFADYAQAGERTRAAGLFAGSNVFGNFLVFPLMLTALMKMKMGVRVTLTVLLFAGVLTSQSRAAAATAAIAVLWLSWNRSTSRWKRSLQTVLVIAAIVMALPVVRDSASSFRGRVAGETVSEDTDTRAHKTMIGVHALFSDYLTALVGARPGDIVLSSYTTEQISDNSYIQVLVSVGLPAGMAFASILWWLVHDRNRAGTRQRKFLRPYWFVVLSAAAINNSILWDIYVFHAAVLYWLFVDARVLRLPYPQLVQIYYAALPHDLDRVEPVSQS